MRILLVEDDPLVGRGLSVGLQQDGFAVDWLTRAEQARHALHAEHFDALILDLGLPGEDGMSLLGDLRNRGLPLPVVILTSRDAVLDRVAGLNLGADDYVIKPVDLAELAARIRAVTRRNGGRSHPVLKHGPLQLDPVKREASLCGEPLALSPREVSLLEILLTHAEHTVPKQRLLDGLYAWGDAIGSNALEVHIHHLRKKLGPSAIRTVRGIGYRLQLPAPP